MRQTGNLHSEWSGAEHAPIIRIALVALALGAVGSSTVMLSLIDAPITAGRVSHSPQAILINAPDSSPAQLRSMPAAPAGSSIMPAAAGVMTTNTEPQSDAQGAKSPTEAGRAHRAIHWRRFPTRHSSDGSIRSER